MTNGLSAEELAIVGLFIAAVLEPIKLFPWITSKKFLPITAIGIGILLTATILRTDAMAIKDVFFFGIMIGLSAIGGRSAVQAAGENKIDNTVSGFDISHQYPNVEVYEAPEPERTGTADPLANNATWINTSEQKS